MTLPVRSSATAYPYLLSITNFVAVSDSLFRFDRANGGATVITDDNMVVEWREPLRYPDLR